MIIGSVAEGKTAFLMSLLGEMKKSSETKSNNDSTNIKQNIAYVPQNPWIINSSIRENILFGKNFCEDWYW